MIQRTQHLLPILLLLGSPAAAQTVFQRPVSSATIQSVVHGNFFGNEEPVTAVAYVPNGSSEASLEVWVDPLLLDTALPVSSVQDVTSVAFSPKGPGELEPLFVTTASGSNAGLSRVRGTVSWQVGVTTHLLAGAWVGARRLRVVEEGGALYVAAIKADASKVLIAEDGGSGWSTTHELTPPLGTAIDFDFVDWDDDGDLDLALLSTSKLWVFDLATDSVVYNKRNDGGTVGGVARVPASPREQLAWATLDASGDPILNVLDSSGLETPIDLHFVPPGGGAAQDLDVSAIAAGDLDADGDLDLVVTDTTGKLNVAFVHDASGSPHFTASQAGTDFVVFDADPLGSGTTGNFVQPTIADADLDGSGDVVLGLGTSGLVSVAGGVVLPATGGGVFISSESTFEHDGDVYFDVVFDLSQNHELFNAWDGIQVTYWREDGVGTGMDSLALDNTVHYFEKTVTPTQYAQSMRLELATPPFGDVIFAARWRFVNFHVDPSTGETIIDAALSAHAFGMDDMKNDANGTITTEGAYLLDLNDDEQPLELDEGTPGGQNNSAGPGNGSSGGWIYTDIQLPGFEGPATVPMPLNIPLARFA